MMLRSLLTLSRHFCKNRRGAVAVEFALLTVVLFSLLTGAVAVVGFVLETGRMERAASNLSQIMSYMRASTLPSTAEQSGIAAAFAAIAGKDPSTYKVFITTISTGSANSATEETAGVSARCPRQLQCLEWQHSDSAAKLRLSSQHYENLVTVEVYWTVNFIGSSRLFTGALGTHYTLRLAHVRPGSCKDLIGLTTTDGTYVIGISGVPYTVYCDMSTDGGGWTLVARSSTSQTATSSSFGWTSATGTLDDDSVPYSLGVLGLNLPFTEALLGNMSTLNTWGSPAYVYDQDGLTSDALSAHLSSAFSMSTPAAVSAGASAAYTTSNYAGFTSQTTGFFMDATNPGGTASGYGLLPGGWATNYYDTSPPYSQSAATVSGFSNACVTAEATGGTGGYLCGSPGMIMVR